MKGPAYRQPVHVKCLKPSCGVSGVEIAFAPEHTDEARRKCWECKVASLRIVECEPPDLGVEL